MGAWDCPMGVPTPWEKGCDKGGDKEPVGTPQGER